MNSRIASLPMVASIAAAGLAAIIAMTPRADGATAPGGVSVPCTATLEPDSVAIRQEPITLVYALSEDIGSLTAVTAPEDSGVEVVAFNAEDSTLDLDTGGALEGAWTLNFVGDAELTCAGTLHVLMAGEGRR